MEVKSNMSHCHFNCVQLSLTVNCYFIFLANEKLHILCLHTQEAAITESTYCIGIPSYRLFSIEIMHNLVAEECAPHRYR